MPAAAGAKVFRHAVVTIDGTEYANQTSHVMFVPDQPTQTRRVLVPDGAVTDVDNPAWTMEWNGDQINRSNGLAHALRALAVGEEVAVTVQDGTAVGDGIATATIRGVMPPFGGTQGEFLSMELVFPVVGQPVFDTVDA